MPFFDHYPYTNLHNVNLDWVLQAVKSWGALVEQNNQNFINLAAANEAFKEYITGYITNLDVQDEINNKLDDMLASGALTQYFSPYIKTDVEEWLEENITPTTPPVDATLSIAGAAADAKATGDAIRDVVDEVETSLNNAIIKRSRSMITSENYTPNTYYADPNTVTASGLYVTFPPIAVTANKKYYFKNLYLSFCWAKRSDNTFFSIAGTREDSFISRENLTLYLTARTTNLGSAIFTDSIDIYNSDSQEPIIIQNPDLFTYQSYNLYDDAVVRRGYVSDDHGTITETGASKYASVSIEKNTVYKILYPDLANVGAGTVGYLAFYDDNTFIRGENPADLTPVTYGTGCYISFNSGNANIVNFAVKTVRLDMENTCIICENKYDFDDIPILNGIGHIEGLAIVDNYARKASQEASVRSVLFGKSITAVGDSITGVYSWANQNWTRKLVEWTGCTMQNLGVSGSGFAAELDGSTRYASRITSIDSNADIIGVAGSFNDLDSRVGLPIGDITDTGSASVCGFINDFFDALITAYPSTPIICYIQSPWGLYHPGNARSDEYVAKLESICRLKGVPFYKELYEGCALKPWIEDNRVTYYTTAGGQSNNIHPNETGHLVIARYLLEDFERNIVSETIV